MLAIKQRVLDMCRLSALCYHDAVDMKAMFDEKKEPVLRRCTVAPVLLENTEDYNDGQAYFSHYSNELENGKQRVDGVLVFRGTENFRDWLSDFNVIRVRMTLPNVPAVEEPKVHFGFIRQYRTIDKDINGLVRKMMMEDNMETLHVTGHSLGGALASIACVALKKEFPNLKIYCYTFGSPRPGDASFSKCFEESVESSHRFLNNNDPVTATPTTWRFRHVPGAHWIYEDGMDTHNRTSHFNRFFKILYHGALSVFGYVSTGLSDYHNISRYYDDIEKMWDGE